MILYLDTETTGLYPGQICQLSYIMQTKEKATSKNFFFSVEFVEYGALKTHGFTVEKLEKLSNGKEFCHFVDEIEFDLNSADVVIAHNTAFDLTFLEKEFNRCGKDLDIKTSFCSMKNSVSACKIPRHNSAGYKYPKLAELCCFLGISEEKIQNYTEQIFSSNVGFHDARFDTTALFLAVNDGMVFIPSMQDLKKYL